VGPSLTTKTSIDAQERALAAAEAAQSKKGQNVSILDLTEQESYADYLVIVSTYSERQCVAVADAVRKLFKNEFDERPMSASGQGVWVLIDYGDVVVHVFHEDARAYYDLDRLWAKAPRIRVPAAEDLRAATG
jgi:ribosome-associated protein